MSRPDKTPAEPTVLDQYRSHAQRVECGDVPGPVQSILIEVNTAGEIRMYDFGAGLDARYRTALLLQAAIATNAESAN